MSGQLEPGQILNMALEKEEAAHRFFVETAKKMEDPGVRKLFEELADEELKHYDLIRMELEGL